jgi:hypothetical protein
MQRLGSLEVRVDLAKRVQAQSRLELAFIRKLAVEEGAAKTTAVIDKLLLDRQQRFENIFKKMEAKGNQLKKYVPTPAEEWRRSRIDRKSPYYPGRGKATPDRDRR